MIASINERMIQSPNDLVTLIASMRPGERVAIQFVRPIPRSQVQAAAPEVQPGAAAVAPPTPETQPTTETLPATPPAPPTPQPTPAG
jgi:hypothetical protein